MLMDRAADGQTLCREGLRGAHAVAGQAIAPETVCAKPRSVARLQQQLDFWRSFPMRSCETAGEDV